MKRELRLGLLCLLIPIMIAAFYLESKLLLSTGAHTLVQVLILTGIYWLAWQWVRFDKFSNLREGSQSRHARYTYRVSYPIKDQIDIKNDQIKQRSDLFEKAPLDKQQVPVPNGKISLKKALSSRHPWLILRARIRIIKGAIMFRLIRPTLVFFGLLTILTGLLYPALITGVAQVIFPYQANGSLMTQNGQVIGSALIGQQFDQPQYFWGRLSATGDHPYNAATSGGSNLGPTNPALQSQISDRIAAIKAADPDNMLPIPVDLVTASASGLDPDISIAAARYQAARVARERGLPLDRVQTLIDQNTTGRTFGFLGESRVNVLNLNLALDELQ